MNCGDFGWLSRNTPDRGVTFFGDDGLQEDSKKELVRAGGFDRVRVLHGSLVVADVAHHSTRVPSHAIVFRLAKRLVGRPMIVYDPVRGDNCAGSISAAAAVHENGAGGR